ncbi:hypothetical protein GDO81_018997 [Engystomops pustulosus]|uniref:Uncharacterized protein n=1 Tax=Engystomops pustulosus TaxID=76066 RepID=A0AAV6YEN6_ENGPU|nr:hypothetical protein GDO81_018997 [Engystomops pustulosus]
MTYPSTMERTKNSAFVTWWNTKTNRHTRNIPCTKVQQKKPIREKWEQKVKATHRFSGMSCFMKSGVKKEMLKMRRNRDM